MAQATRSSLNKTTGCGMRQAQFATSFTALTTTNLALNKVGGVLAYITRELTSQGLQV